MKSIIFCLLVTFACLQTEAANLPPPTLSVPSNGATGVSTAPTYSWSAVSGVISPGYWLAVATSSATLPTDPAATIGPGCVIFETANSTSDTPTTVLNGGTTYYWRVRGRGPGSTNGTWSTISYFTTTAAVTRLSAPTFSAPANAATGVSTTTSFSWSQVSGNQGYRIVVSTSASDLPTDPTQSGGTPANGFNQIIGQNTTSYPGTGTLIAGTTYYWEVHALATTLPQAGYWSSQNYFSTISIDYGDPPSTVTPGTGTWIRANQNGDFSGSYSISSGTAVNVYAFVANQTGSYVISTGGSLDSQLRIYNSSGTAITSVIDSTSGGETTTLSLAYGSWYYIAVAGYQLNTGSYTLSVNGPDLPRASIATPAPNYTGIASGYAIDYGGDLDYFQITAPSGTTSLDLILGPSAGLDTYGQLYNSSGTLLTAFDTGGSGVVDVLNGYPISAGATYYVGVSSSRTGTGSYTLSVDFNPNQPSTLVISSVTPTAVQTEDWGQSVVYTITVTDSVGNPVSGATVGGDDYVRIVSYNTLPNTTDANGHITYTTTVPSGEANGTYNITFVATRSGYNMSSSVTRQVQVLNIPTSFGGTVTDSSTGSPISGATVTWGTTYSTTTAANGIYSINNITCGTATLTVSKNGYQTYSQSYTPTCNASNQKNISLVSGFFGTISPPWWLGGPSASVFIKRYPVGAAASIDPNLRTWIIIHGRNGSSTDQWVVDLAGAIAGIYSGDQILLLDWSTAAHALDFPDVLIPETFQEDWIKPVAAWAAGKLVDYGFAGSSINLIGHSWGGSMTAEIAELIPYVRGHTVNFVNSIVALDPAKNGTGAYDPEDPTADNGLREVDFARNSAFSWAFHSSNFGSEQTPATAHEAFRVIDASGDAAKQHSDVTWLFSYFVRHSSGISGLFQLDRLLNRQYGPWVLNQFDSYGVQNGVLGYPGYEGVIFTAADGQSPDQIEYVPTTPEITVLGNGISIADGDTTPSSTDGTDFGSVIQGQAGPTRTFTVRNDGGSLLT